MKLYYMRQDILEDLKNNAANNIENYKSESNQWILDEYENPFLEYKRSVDDFDLLVDSTDVGYSDIENVKIIHSNLRFLTKSEAADERLWAGLTHSVFWDFMKKRWEKRPVKEERQIHNRYFLMGSSSNKRGLLMNTISRYWWIGELLFDEENSEAPYYLIETLREDFTTFAHTLLTSNFTSNSSIVKGVLKPILTYNKENGNLSRDEFTSVIRYANLIGGSYLLDYLSIEEIQEKIQLYIDTTIRQESRAEARQEVKEEFDEKQGKSIQGQVRDKKGIFNKFRESFLGYE